MELAASGIDHGGDIGVESAGVVPLDGGVLLADRGTPQNPHPGTDSVLRIDPAELVAAGVAPGDILVASEGGAVTVDLRCGTTCTVRTVATGPAPAHAEGRILGLGPVPGLGAAPASTTPGASDRGRVIRGVASLAVGLALVGLAFRRLLRRSAQSR